MEVAFVHPSRPGAEGTGATHSATRVVTELRDRGHEVTVYCPSPPPDEVGDGRPDDASDRTEYLAGNWLPQGHLELNRAIRQRVEEFADYDVVHSYRMRAIPALETIRERVGTPTVVTLNAYGGTCAKNDLLYLDSQTCSEKSLAKCTRCILGHARERNERTATRAASLFVNYYLVRRGERHLDRIDGFRAPSGHVKRKYVEMGFPQDRIRLIPHPLDETFMVDHRSTFAPPYQLLFVGALERRKGAGKLSAILEHLEELDDRRYELTVVGDGPMRAQMERDVRGAGLEDVVSFTGFVPYEELPSVYAAHDIFVYPCLWDEPCGRVYLEALATATPVVSAEYGTIGDIIGDGGVTCPPDPEEFARTIQRVAGPELADYSRAAKDHVERYRPSTVGAGIEELYEDVIARTTVDG